MAGETVPAGFLEENGAAVSRTAYAALFAYLGTTHGQGDGATTFNLPDSRGEFHRGWDHGRGVDPDRASRTAAATGGLTGDHVGTVQGGGLASHTHTGITYVVDWYGGDPGTLGLISRLGTPAGNYQTTTTDNRFSMSGGGGSETRPRNRTRMYCIKY